MCIGTLGGNVMIEGTSNHTASLTLRKFARTAATLAALELLSLLFDRPASIRILHDPLQHEFGCFTVLCAFL